MARRSHPLPARLYQLQDPEVMTFDALEQDSILIQGGAYAVDGLGSLSLTANETEIYSTTWAAPVPTDTLWSTTWAPVDGVYELLSVVKDVNGQEQAGFQPIVVTVDRQPPVVTWISNPVSIHDRISYNRVYVDWHSQRQPRAGRRRGQRLTVA